MPAEFGVETRALGKAYRSYPSAWARGLEGLTLGRLARHREFWALRDIDLAVPRGGSLGLVGANGAGKSTLLKILAGTAAPSAGRFRTAGRVTSLLDLGAGFHPEFSGRDNIRLQAALLGYSRSEVHSKAGEIEDFAELGDFLDEPLRTYSAGMGMRLGFSVAMAMDPEVLILDEVFAVGDVYFQKKCTDRIFDLKRCNKTILFCSHSLYSIRQLCDTALWLEHGRVAARGEPGDVTDRYYASQQYGAPLVDGGDEPSDGAELPGIVDARIVRLGTDETVREVETGESLEVQVLWRNPQAGAGPVTLGIGFLRQDMTLCVGESTRRDGVALAGASGCTSLELPVFGLGSGSFVVVVWLMDAQGVHKHHEFTLTERLVVRSDASGTGVFTPVHRWREQPWNPATGVPWG